MTTKFDMDFEAAAADDLVSELGEAGAFSYVDESGTETSGLDGVWEPAGVMDETFTGESERDVESGMLLLRASDVTAPSIHGSVKIGGETWAIKRVVNLLPMVELEVERRVEEAIGGKGHGRNHG